MGVRHRPCVLEHRPNGLSLPRIYDDVRELRNPADLPKPKEFEATVRSTIYSHSAETPKWNGNEQDDLFRRPKRGVWKANADRVAAWLQKS